MINLKVVVLILSLSALAGSAFSQERSVKDLVFESYPTTEDECDAIAQGLKRALASQTGRTILSYRCKEGSYWKGGFDILIKYIGEKLDSEPAAIDWLYGGYPSSRMCQEDLDTQRDQFINETARSIFTSYCAPKGYLYIYSFDGGSDKRRLFQSTLRGSDYFIGDVVLENREELESDLFNAVEGLGASPSRVMLEENGDVHIYYYSDVRLNIMFIQYTGYSTVADCEAQKRNVSQVVNTFGGETLLQICAPTEDFPMPGAELFNFVAYPYPFMFSQIYTLYMEDVGARYQSLAECNGDKSRIYSVYRNQLGKEVYGSSCSYIDGESMYQMLIFRTAELN